MQARRILALLLLLCCAGARAQMTCGPSPLGQPCGQGGIATLPGMAEPGVNLGAGNPVHLATGNKYQQELDLPASLHAPRLELRRHYNSLDPRDAALGRGWAWSYDTRLYQAGGRWQIVQADGSRIVFDGPGRRARHALHGFLQRRAGLWIWIWPDKQENHFDAQGRLARIVFPGGDALHIERHPGAGPQADPQSAALAGLIARLVSSRGPALAFHYRVQDGRACLERVDSPAGTFRYTVEPVSPRPGPGSSSGAGRRLREVLRPDGMRRRYLYEPRWQAGHPHHLTGIQIISADGSQALRIGAWAYDARGRATLWARGEPDDSGRLQLRYLEPATPQRQGVTEVRDAAGRTTRMRIALIEGQYKVLQVDGVACAGCPAPGTRARYDAGARLLHVNGTDIVRAPSGRVRAIRSPGAGWPGLELRYGPTGLRTSWSSTLTGTERMRYDALGRPAQRRYANGDRWAYRYDAQGRPDHLLQAGTQGPVRTRLSWRGALPVRIVHPQESEIRHYDDRQRLVRRDIERPASATRPGMRYSEAFEYDQAGRMTRHQLPEGGALHYRWGPLGRLLAIEWLDAQGRRHAVISGVPQRPGYRYGNGLELQVLVSQRQARDLVLRHGANLLWAQHNDYDNRGRLQQERHTVPALGHERTWRYAYDAQSRLVGAQRKAAAHPTWYAWNADGSLAARGRPGHSVKPSVARDASGLPTAHDGYRLDYGPQRRLASATRGTQTHRYFHNAYGQRIAVRSPAGDADYFYLDNRLVAEARHGAAGPAAQAASGRPAITRRYIHARHALVGFIDYATDPSTHAATATLYAVHSDLLGAPRLVTDARRAIRWLADYSPLGTATRIAGDLELDLRLPGQILDRGTGWHDNLLRTYLPGLGQYLEPDPLGPVPGGQALGYARQQPRRHTDPLGLLLFAFDGTRNSPVSQTNVWKMSQWYQDGPVFYQAGPGNPNYLDWDAITAYTAPLILDAQWQALLAELADPENRGDVIPIDIIGFSRGAALARHFGNMIVQQVRDGLFSYQDEHLGLVTACVDLRFMGLFDTVAQFGLNGTANALYDLSIASAWQWVAHAVALQEYRWLFPLTSVAEAPGGNTVEAPFIGAHSDIGGGLAVDEEGRYASRGDLSDVALNWMLWQARAALVRLDTPPAADREITEPILHDQRSALMRSAYDGDRAVQAADGSTQFDRQIDHPELGRQRRAATEQLIWRIADWLSSASNEVGTVDMAGYGRWLQQELGWQSLPA